MSDKVNAVALVAARILLAFSEGDEDSPEWQDLRDCLEALVPDMQPPQSEHMQNAITDFDQRLQVKMIGRP